MKNLMLFQMLDELYLKFHVSTIVHRQISAYINAFYMLFLVLNDVVILICDGRQKLTKYYILIQFIRIRCLSVDNLKVSSILRNAACLSSTSVMLFEEY